jgi:hypothetical protein
VGLKLLLACLLVKGLMVNRGQNKAKMNPVKSRQVKKQILIELG